MRRGDFNGFLIMQCCCSTGQVFTPRFLKIVLGVKSPGQPHVLLRGYKGMLAEKYFRSNKSSVVSDEFIGDHKTVTQLR